MALNFATPLAHETVFNYVAYNNTMTVGRPFRQPVTTAPNANNFSDGLEIFLSNTGNSANLYSWLNGILKWEQGAGGVRPHKIIIETGPENFLAGRSARNFSTLKILESHPQKAIYHNPDQAEVQTALEKILNDAYTFAGTHPVAQWHPCMRMRIGNPAITLKAYIDAHLPATNTVQSLINDLITGAAGALLTQVSVRAGDLIGKADLYLATDSLPPAPLFPLGAPADVARARRITFTTVDAGNQLLNPLYYLNIYMQQMLLPAATRSVTAITAVLNGTVIDHPLVTLFPVLGNASPPVAREQINGQFMFPLRALNNYHGYPADAPNSLLEWRYSNDVHFEPRARVVGSPVPNLVPVVANITKTTNFWNTYGGAVNSICQALQVPCLFAISTMGSEALPSLDPRAVRMEPLLARNRSDMSGIAGATALELEYDKMVGLRGTITAATYNNNDTTSLDITLDANRSHRANILKKHNWFLLVDEVDRLKIKANTAGAATSNYTIRVEDKKNIGGMPAGTNQPFGNTLFYSPDTRAAGNAAWAPVEKAWSRNATLRRLRVTSSANTLDGTTTIVVFVNGAATALAVTLAAGHRAGSNNADTVAIVTGDTVAVQVVTNGAHGSINNLVITMLSSPVNAGFAWILEGYSTSVPNPWNGAALVRTGVGRTLTWDQLVTIITATNGRRVSPGLLQTLIGTAKDIVQFLNNIIPGIYTTLGYPAPPSAAGDYLNSWLLTGEHSILLGIALIRKQYNTKKNQFDLPLVGAAYNSGSLRNVPNSSWALNYFGDYVGHSAPCFNAGVDVFNGPPAPANPPTVHFML